MAMDLIKYLNVPTEKSVRYGANFIRTAVCELRFPTLLELEEKPPIKLQHALRKSYPHYSKAQAMNIGEDGATPAGKHYQFESRKRDWIVSLRPHALTLETHSYVDFEDFFVQLRSLLASAKDSIDTDFFTRVGLRYINVVPLEDANLDGWINSDLIVPVLSGALGSPSRYDAEIRGFIDENVQYTFRHGFNPQEPTHAKSEYVLDFDYSSENVELGDALALVTRFHEVNFSFFRWALGNKAKNKLGAGNQKNRGT